MHVTAYGLSDTPLPLRMAADTKLILQAQLLHYRGSNNDGLLVAAVQIPWRRILSEFKRDPSSRFQFANNPRAFEEFIAGAYQESGEWDEVVLTPRSRDGGRDVIVSKHGFGSVRFLEQAKAYSPGTLVTHDDIRAMLGVLTTDPNSSKAIITTTADFQPEIYTSKEFAPFLPYRLELKDGAQLLEWLGKLYE